MSEDDGRAEESTWSESLRERKKRLTRSLISNTATAMFLERGFEDVRVAEIAEACGVSEKTVYNYFPTKESLLFDREPEIAAEIWRVLGTDTENRSPVAAMLDLLDADREESLSHWSGDGAEVTRRFGELIDATPALQAELRDMADRLERTTAEALAAEAGVSPDEPEPRVAAAALMALWRIQFDVMRRCATERRSAAETRELVKGEVERAGRVAESGLWWFKTAGGTPPNRQQLKLAADATATAGRQILAALRQARASWDQTHREHAASAEREYGFEGLADFIEETARWKREMVEQRDEWKRAYRDEQTRLRATRRDMARQFRQAAQDHARGRGRKRES